MSDTGAYHETITWFGVLHLHVDVRVDGLYVRLKPIQRSPSRVSLDDIAEARVVSYSASKYGGWHWGMRIAPGGNMVYRLRGKRGVELMLADGRRIFIGSQRPNELHAAIPKLSSSDASTDDAKR